MDQKRHSPHHRPFRGTYVPLLAVGIAFTVAAGVFGYLLATSRDAEMLSQNQTAVDAAHYHVLAAMDESLSQRIERINVEQQALEQAKVISRLQGEIDSVQKTVVDALT
jgi:hypothetical protein